jgi:hypothetical protein
LLASAIAVAVAVAVTVMVVVVVAVANIYHRRVRKRPTEFQGRHVCGDILLWMRE